MRILLALVFAIGCDGAIAPADAGMTSDAGMDVDGGAPASDEWMAGVNLAGAEFGEVNLPGVYDTDYTYPTEAEIDYFVAHGMNVVRIAFRWERLQRSLNAELDATELGRLDAITRYSTAHGARVILDPHNYARYGEDVIGSGALPNAAFADFWGRLAAEFADDDDVIFGIVNEPHDMPTEQWLAAANAAIAAIRSAGAHNLVLVPGNSWTGAWSWSATWYGTPNAEVMDGVVDPDDRFAIEVHQYLDTDSSGRNAECVSETIGSQRVSAFTTWLREHGLRGFLGELGAGDNTTCEAGIHDLLDHLEANDDVWLGWTWWAAGPWWGDYMFSIEPNDDGSDRPQMSWLADHL